MGAGKFDLKIDQGSSFYTKLTISDASKNLIDLTGSTFAGKIKKKISDPTARVAFTFTILDQTTNKGEVEVTLTAVQTAAIQLAKQDTQTRVAESFCYDIEMTDSLSVVTRIMQGVVHISPEVTK